MRRTDRDLSLQVLSAFRPPGPKLPQGPLSSQPMTPSLLGVGVGQVL